MKVNNFVEKCTRYSFELGQAVDKAKDESQINMMAEANRLDRFMDEDDDFLDEAIALGQVESRCELCTHFLGITS